MTKSLELPCPTCKIQVQWNDQFPNRPFCSKRCQLIDLGAWADEEHVISTDIVNDFDDSTVEH